MKKDFTFKNYLTYLLRYWLIVALCAVVGLGAGLLYGAFSEDAEYVTYRGGLSVGGYGVFADELAVGDGTENVSLTYDRIKEGALTEMSSTQIQVDFYKSVETEWKSLQYNKELTAARLSQKFFDSLNVTVSGHYVYVSFTQPKNRFEDEQNAFSAKAVNAYIAMAYDRAIEHEPSLGSNTEGVNQKLRKISAELILSVEEKDNSLVSSIALGGALGLVVGAVVMLAVYFADKRINSYGDIAAFTGLKLYDVCKGNVTNKACPRIDCDMGKSRVVLVTGSEESAKRLSILYGEYAASAGNRTLRVDFARTDDVKAKDSFKECVEGSGTVSVGEHGVDTLTGGYSWALAVKNSERIKEIFSVYERVVICAPYRGDGSLGVLSSVSDKIVFAVDQSAMRVPDVLAAASEAQSADKVIGTVIEKAGKSFVGGNIYVPISYEEE